MKLKKGMKVRIKSYDQLVHQYGKNSNGVIDMPYSYMSYMDKYLNTIVIINTVNGNGEIIGLQNVKYSWHRDMFIPVKLPLSFKQLLKTH